MNYKLLVLDDGLGVAKLVRSILVDQPFDVIEGDENKPFAKQAKAQQADLVLLDFNISIEKNGYEICASIKAELKNVKVVLVFDTFDQPDNAKLQEFNIDDYLYRPFDGEKLIKTCRHMMGLETTRITKIKELSVQEDQTGKTNDQIEEEMTNWEILVPDVINARAEFSEELSDFDNNLVPGIIEKVDRTASTNTNKSRNEPAYPSQDDLAFPDEPTRTEQTMVLKAAKIPEKINEDSNNQASTEEKTEVVDLTKIAAAQKDLLGKLKEQIQDEVETDFWSPEEADKVPAEMSKDSIESNITNSSPAVMAGAEKIFDKVEQNAMKHEIMATIRDQMLVDLKKDILKDLREEIITKLSPEDRKNIVEDLKANVYREMKERIYEDLFSKLSKEIHHEIWHKLKEELFHSGSGYLESKISDYFQKDVIPLLKEDVPALTQELIKNELIRIRRLIDSE